jgi:hypothetical protein
MGVLVAGVGRFRVLCVFFVAPERDGGRLWRLFLLPQSWLGSLDGLAAFFRNYCGSDEAVTEVLVASDATGRSKVRGGARTLRLQTSNSSSHDDHISRRTT